MSSIVKHVTVFVLAQVILSIAYFERMFLLIKDYQYENTYMSIF